MPFLTSHRSVKNLRGLWPASHKKKESAPADQVAAAANEQDAPSAVVRHPTEPVTGGERQHPRISLAILQPILQGGNIFTGLEMTATATIRFARPGVRAPVFVVTSASSPPWALIEMLDSGDRTATGEIIFERTFDDIPQGAHQYKIRVGQDQWILEEDKETATDEAGNRNNVVHSELKFNNPGSPIPKPNTTYQAQGGEGQQGPQWREHRQDSVQASHPPVSKGGNKLGELNLAVDDQERQAREVSTAKPVIGLRGNGKLILDQRHAEPGTMEQRQSPLFSHETLERNHPLRQSPPVSPTRAIDGELSQFSTVQTGPEVDIASHSEKDLNGLRLPHELHKQQAQPHDELENAPRLPHETVRDCPSRSSMGKDDEFTIAPLMSHETGPVVAHQRGDVVTDELHNAPLFSHETEMSSQSSGASESSGVEHGPLMAEEENGTYDGLVDEQSPSEPLSELESTPSSPSESGLGSPRVGGRDGRRNLSPEQKAVLRRRRRGMIIQTTPVPSGDGAGELDQAPLLSHEVNLSPQTEYSDDSVGELDRAPAMSHEADTNGAVSELDRAPVLPHEANSSGDPSEYASTTDDSGLTPALLRGTAALADDDDNEADEAPLLPHERPSPVRASSNKDLFREAVQLPAMAFQGPSSPPVFRHTGSSLWRARSHSSSLPHSLPRSDEEDDNLNDPSLEPFPTVRQHILERVATIGHHLPEDETIPSPGGLHSPAIMSQACSSIDLAPVGSHSSLQRINEDAVMEVDEDGDEDVALGSPVLELSFRTNGGGAPAPTGDVETGDFPTPLAHRRRGNYFELDSEGSEDGQQQNGGHEEQSGTGEADERTLVGSVYGHDGVGERDMFAPSARRRWTPDALAQPARPLNPVLTDPATPERRRLFPWEFVEDQNEIDLQTALAHSPPQQRVYRSPLYLRAWRRLFS